MGDRLELRGIEVIQDGLFQIDVYNNTRNEGYRVFVIPDIFFSMIGSSMQKNYTENLRKWHEEMTELKSECKLPIKGE